MRLKALIKALFELRWKYLLNGSIVRVRQGGRLVIEPDVKIRKSRISVSSDSICIIESHSSIKSIELSIHGVVEFGHHSIIESVQSTPLSIIIRDNGVFKMGHHNRIRSKVWIRFGGVLSIGSHTNINEGSEIRVDEAVTIGSFCQISYNVIIWDTNTHNIYNRDKRRLLTIDKFPIFGFEFERPKTTPVIIGDDCWVGRNVSLLKGTQLMNAVVVGYGVTLVSHKVESNNTVVANYTYRTIPNGI
jgi:acetyltransferase-like isoleucine patch superfamily enzyme